MKRNNPLNIRYSTENNWIGQLADENGFVKFASPYYGMRAALRLLCNYIVNGCNTIEDIIYRWAPPSENKTESYIDFVLGIIKFNGLSICRDEPIEGSFTTFSTRFLMAVLLQAMNMFENGYCYHLELSYDDWFKLMDKPKIIRMLSEFESEIGQTKLNL